MPIYAEPSSLPPSNAAAAHTPFYRQYVICINPVSIAHSCLAIFQVSSLFIHKSKIRYIIISNTDHGLNTTGGLELQAY